MSIPRFEDYGVSAKTGFLPEEPPLAKLSSAFAPWETVVNNLPSLIQTGHIRSVVDAMPNIPVGKMRNIREQRRAYSILGFLAHAYVWSPPKVCDSLPPQLSDPLITLAHALGVPPLATYAGLCLWNFRVLAPPDSSSGAAAPAEQEWDLSNLQALQMYTNSRDEEWFYIISVAMEKQGGPCLYNGIAALKACFRKNEQEVADRLDKLAEDIEELTKIMMRMSEHLDPHFFYHKLRPFLAGWKGMEQAGLPDGVRYGNEQKKRQYSGGSNGQSSLIQALDILLNVDHHALGHRAPPGPIPEQKEKPSPHSVPPGGINETSAKPTPGNAYLLEMRNYMPKQHREYLTALENCAIIRPFVLARKSSNPQLTQSYDRCLQSLRDFRSRHIQIVMRYISLPSRKKCAGIGLAGRSGGEKGTGGTDLMPFLKQTRDEVSDAAAGEWKRSIVSSVSPHSKTQQQNF